MRHHPFLSFSALSGLLFGLSFTSAQLFGAQSAQAQGLGPCGDIHVEAEAQCEVVAPGVECEAHCTPISVEAACAAKLEVMCDGECSASAEVDCGPPCEIDCNASCEIDPGQFDCAGECSASCGAECSGMCSASGNKAECEGSCHANCDSNCDVSCNVELPSAECEGKCEASCDGQCEAKAEARCQIMCQSDGYADCKFDVQGGCEAACRTEEGALFCDSSYVDHGDNLAQCVAALKAAINIDVQGYAEGGSSCESGEGCEAHGKAGVSCTALPGQHSDSSAFGAAALLASLALVWRRKRSA